MRPLAFVIGCVPLAGALACGSSDTVAVATPHVDTSTVTEYQSYAADLQTSLTAYGGTMMSSSTLTSCRAAHEQYDAAARPTVVKMVDMGKAMDAFMETHAGEMITDMSCVAAAMLTELDRHAAAACASTDETANRTEVGRHVGAMAGYDAHVKDRCSTMMQAGSTDGMNWSAPMTGCQ